MSQKDKNIKELATAIDDIIDLIEVGNAPAELMQIYKNMNDRKNFTAFMFGYGFARSLQISVRRGETSIFMGKHLLPFVN